jgi:hypothetical protein
LRKIEIEWEPKKGLTVKDKDLTPMIIKVILINRVTFCEARTTLQIDKERRTSKMKN